MDEGSDDDNMVMLMRTDAMYDNDDRADQDCDDGYDTMPIKSWSWSCVLPCLSNAEISHIPAIHTSLASGFVPAVSSPEHVS